MDGMKVDYENEHSSCMVLKREFLPVGAFELHDLQTEEDFRGQGCATELLQQVCHDADIEGAVLVLSSASEALHAFYQRFGFSAIQPRPALMARMPQIYKVKMNPISSAAFSVLHGR
jgi:GNAT superfamily N-acetyltransferase